MPNVFLQLWLDFRIIQMEMKEESSSYHQYHACIFFYSSIHVQLHSKSLEGFSFLSKSLLLKWSLFIRLNRSADFQFLGEIQSYLFLLPFHYSFRDSFFYHLVNFKGQNVHFRHISDS